MAKLQKSETKLGKHNIVEFVEKPNLWKRLIQRIKNFFKTNINN